MIKNERQYRITKAQAEKFEKTMKEMTKSPEREVSPVLRKAQIDAMKSQLSDLRRDIEEYEASSGEAALAHGDLLLQPIPHAAVPHCS